MSEQMLIWTEVGFNLAYLVVVWGLVVAMLRNRPPVDGSVRRQADLVLWAFVLLALGDTGHVGLRVVAYSMGDLESTFNLLGREISLVGLGTIATAITVTLFYVLVLELWRERFNQRYRWFEYLLLVAIIIRFVLMASPQNQWNQATPVQPWVTLRNLPFFLAGFGIATLMIRDARRAGDKPFLWIGIMIVISFACYVPVILFVHLEPMLGMLMIPKTVAYLVIGFIAYRDLYARKAGDLIGAVERSNPA